MYRLRRLVHFAVYFSLKNTATVRKFFHRNVNIFNCTGNPPLLYKQLSSNSSRTVKNRRAELT
jgi:hypothetical protein